MKKRLKVKKVSLMQCAAILARSMTRWCAVVVVVVARAFDDCNKWSPHGTLHVPFAFRGGRGGEGGRTLTLAREFNKWPNHLLPPKKQKKITFIFYLLRVFFSCFYIFFLFELKILDEPTAFYTCLGRRLFHFIYFFFHFWPFSKSYYNSTSGIFILFKKWK